MKKQKDEQTAESTVEKVENENITEEVEEGQKPAKEKKPKDAKRIANTIINIVLVIAIVIAAFCTYLSFISTNGNGVPSIFGVEFLTVKTNSMYPEFSAGDLIFARRVKDTSALKEGDIITYWTVIEGERSLNTHRIVSIYDGGAHLVFKTKGDNNSINDDLDVHEAEIVGQYNGKKLKGAGSVLDFLKTSKGFFIVVVLPVALFFIYHLIQFFRVLFEYQSVKNRLLYEQEREAEENAGGEGSEEEKKKELEKLEAEIRAKIMEEMKNQKGNDDPGKSEE